ncbi:MAG: nucleotidyltransferase [Puniceicoccales bacterium]|jgi:UTP-glucose-1-phosphate uridylyltransferase|nr:nucleotidyltransferase [Puniceicoccales bacterium]
MITFAETGGTNVKPTLLVLAAGMGTRYGGLKQMDVMGHSGEALLDYSVFDAIRAGFGKVVFIIRPDFADEFKTKVAARFDSRVEVDYAFQTLDALPAGYTPPAGREKPWGTAHAVLCARDVVREPFCVINADDFYGRPAYEAISAHLAGTSTQSTRFAMVGFTLRNTLSEHGTVTRGVCRTDAAGFLTDIAEMTKISRTDTGAVNREAGAPEILLTGNEPVSMNIWGFSPKLFDLLDSVFREFLGLAGHELKSECYLPVAVGSLVKNALVSCKVLRTDSEWFGITYREDKSRVQACISQLIKSGQYPANLWA